MGVLVFLNGQFVPESQAVVPVNDRGFLLGDGLFETMRVAAGRPFRFAQHLERLARGAEFLKIKLPFMPTEVEKIVDQLIEQNQMPEAVLRITLTRGPGGRGYGPDKNTRPTFVMTLHPLPPPAHPAGWSLITSSLRVPSGDSLAAFKTTSKILHVMARAEAVERGADEALLVNTDGEVAETAGGNVFWVSDGNVCTIPSERGILPGVTRAAVLEICRTLGLPVSERVIVPEEFKKAKGVFVTQSVFGVVPVAKFDGKPISSSPLVDQIARTYREMLLRP
jgi:aminodeoxychorismate lyase